MLEKSKALKLRAADEGELPEAVDSGLGLSVEPVFSSTQSNKINIIKSEWRRFNSKIGEMKHLGDQIVYT